ncbi:MAG: hypothetical protein EOP78_05795, partial [Variovorax sp.]
MTTPSSTPSLANSAADPASASRAGPSTIAAVSGRQFFLADFDFALHLPLRYEDETRITLLRDARDGDLVQIEG